MITNLKRRKSKCASGNRALNFLGNFRKYSESFLESVRVGTFLVFSRKFPKKCASRYVLPTKYVHSIAPILRFDVIVILSFTFDRINLKCIKVPSLQNQIGRAGGMQGNSMINAGLACNHYRMSHLQGKAVMNPE